MLIAAAVCPHPPLLVPEVTGASDPAVRELRRVRTVCRDAVAALLGTAPDLLVVVGGAGQTTEYPAIAGGSLGDFAVPFTVGADPVLPLSLTIGKWLLAGAVPPSPPVTWQGIASDAATAECVSLGEKLAALAARVALLVMGDGPGRRARGVPGATDPEADRYDDQVSAALTGADPGALTALDPRHDQELFVAGRAAWQVLAGAASAASAGAFTADLCYTAAPFEVSYYVATWMRAH
jgi:hypothetical protein